MAASLDVCIRGAGIVGRTLALLLARQGLRVALVAPAEPGPRSAGVRACAISPSNQQLLQQLRCWLPEAKATPVRAMQVLGDDRGAVRFSADRLGVAALNWAVELSALEQHLTDACSNQEGLKTVAEAVAASLTVICDRNAGPSYAQLGIDFESTPCAQRALATRLRCEHGHQQTTHQWFMPGGDILAFLPVGGAVGHDVAAVWAAPPEQIEAAADWSDAELAAHLQELSGDVLGTLSVQGARDSWPLARGQATHWIGTMPAAPDQAFVLAGDAAHVMHPLVGPGLNTGLGDAAELAAVLAAREAWRPLHERRLLRRYERARRAEWQRVRLATNGLQQVFAHPAPAAGKLRNCGMLLFDHSGPIKHRVARLAMGIA